MAEYKEFRYPSMNKNTASDSEYDHRYSVLILEKGDTQYGGATEYIFKANDTNNNFVIGVNEIDRYIDILTWLKNYKKEEK